MKSHSINDVVVVFLFAETTAMNPQFYVQIPRTDSAKCHVVVSCTQHYETRAEEDKNRNRTMHAIGFAVGYAFARLFGYDRAVSRTISIEVGMQNSGLGVVLAQRHFPAEPLTAVPCAISSVVHSVIGSVLAGWWRMRP